MDSFKEAMAPLLPHESILQTHVLSRIPFDSGKLLPQNQQLTEPRPPRAAS